MDFAPVEIAAVALEIAEEQPEMDSAEAGTEVDSVEMDLPGMDSPQEVVESEPFAASQGPLKSSGYSDSAIQMGC
jgi:hypothetical protein